MQLSLSVAGISKQLWSALAMRSLFVPIILDQLLTVTVYVEMGGQGEWACQLHCQASIPNFYPAAWDQAMDK